MRVGLVGLGRMGGGMARRLVAAGLQVAGLDVDAATRRAAAEHGVTIVESLSDLVAELTGGQRLVWVMLPAGEATRATIRHLGDLLDHGDIVVDGGNSHASDANEHAADLGRHGIRFADVGVSGGQWGWRTGYGLMVGADPDVFASISPMLKALAGDDGAARVGGVGSGHLVKAIHNAVQYGVLQAYAEGYALLTAHDEVDPVAAMSAWQAGSSVRSWLLEQTLAVLRENPTLDGVGAAVPDSGTGRWTAQEAVRLAVPTPVLAAALHARFASRAGTRAQRLLVAAREQIGGHRG